MDKKIARIKLMLSPLALKLVQSAVGHAGIQKHTVFSHMPSSSTRDVPLTLDEANEVLHALRIYAEQEVREGSDSHKMALELTAVLGDFCATPQAGGVEEAKLDEAEPTQDVKAQQVADAFERSLQEKRDAIFRQIIGRPADLNIWGMPRQERNLPPKRIPVSEAPPSTRTRDGNVISPPRQRLTSIVDEELSEALTENRPVTYNEDMKREGAQELLDARQNHGAGESRDMTQADWDAAQKRLDDDALDRVAKAQQAKDAQAEIAALSVIWD